MRASRAGGCRRGPSPPTLDEKLTPWPIPVAYRPGHALAQIRARYHRRFGNQRAGAAADNAWRAVRTPAGAALSRRGMRGRRRHQRRRGRRAEDQPHLFSRLSLRPEARREGHVHPQPARRRLVRQLAAPLLSAARLHRQVPPRRRHAVLAAPRLVGRRRWLSAEHRLVGDRDDRPREHQGVLARRAFAGRPDVHANHLQRLLRDEGRWVPESLGRPRRRSGRTRRELRHSRAGGARSGADAQRRPRVRPPARW